MYFEDWKLDIVEKDSVELIELSKSKYNSCLKKKEKTYMDLNQARRNLGGYANIFRTKELVV